MIKALKIPTDRALPIEVIDLEEGSKDDPYQAAKHFLDNWAERVRIGKSPLNRTGDEEFVLYVDEEGMLKHLPINEHATEVLYRGVLAGEVILCKEEQIGPEIIMCGLSEPDIVFLSGVLNTPIALQS